MGRAAVVGMAREALRTVSPVFARCGVSEEKLASYGAPGPALKHFATVLAAVIASGAAPEGAREAGHVIDMLGVFCAQHALTWEEVRDG